MLLKIYAWRMIFLLPLFQILEPRCEEEDEGRGEEAGGVGRGRCREDVLGGAVAGRRLLTRPHTHRRGLLHAHHTDAR